MRTWVSQLHGPMLNHLSYNHGPSYLYQGLFSFTEILPFSLLPFGKKVALPPIKVFGKKSLGIDFGPDFEFRSNPAENVSESCQLKILRSYPRPRREILIFSDPVKTGLTGFRSELTSLTFQNKINPKNIIF